MTGNSLKFSDETNLPDGTYPIMLRPTTQEKFDCVIDWDLSALEPHKIILSEKVKGDLEEFGEGSDFYALKQQIKVNICSIVQKDQSLKFSNNNRYYLCAFFNLIENSSGGAFTNP